jgi:hypothetical protein
MMNLCLSAIGRWLQQTLRQPFPAWTIEPTQIPSRRELGAVLADQAGLAFAVSWPMIQWSPSRSAECMRRSLPRLQLKFFDTAT